MGSGVRRDDIIMYVFFSGPAMVVACCFSCSIDDSCGKRKAVAHVCIMMVSFVFYFSSYTARGKGEKGYSHTMVKRQLLLWSELYLL